MHGAGWARAGRFEPEEAPVIQESTKYRSAVTLCEFLTGVAYVMEASGALNDGMSDRVEELMEPIRPARDWLWAVGKLITEAKPLPANFDVSLDAAEVRALDALPKLKALIGEACDQLAETSRGSVRCRAQRSGSSRADEQGGT
jgi:hypothetical protein